VCSSDLTAIPTKRPKADTADQTSVMYEFMLCSP
jgi:hypothetical protein